MKSPFGFTSYELAAPVVCVHGCGKSTSILRGTPSGPHIKGHCPHCGKYIKFVSNKDAARLRAKDEDKKGTTETVNILTATKHEGLGSITEIIEVGEYPRLKDVGRALQAKYDGLGKEIVVELDRVPGIHKEARGETIRTERFGSRA